jgi:hypothetical protein
MGFFNDLMGKSQANDAKMGETRANAFLDQYKDVALGNINSGYKNSSNELRGARGELRDQNAIAQNALTSGRDAAMGQLNPYIQSGTQANELYSNALGLNGEGAQRAFGSNYAASDPFRAQNANFANEQLMQVLNARGLSGSGYAGQAVADQSLRRGSEDYNNYLNRLQGQGQQGFNASSQAAQFQNNYGQNRAGQANTYSQMNTGIRGQIGQNYTDRGNALATLNYGYGQQKANNATNLANSLAASRTAGVNNLMGLGGLALKAASGGFTPPTGA